MRITFEDTPRLAHVSEDGMRNQSILSHLEGTAVIAERFAKSFGGQEQARTAGLLHDIGKYSDGFQKRLKGGKKVDHSTAGAKVAMAQKQPEVAFAIAGHHSGLPDGGSKTDTMDSPTLCGRLKKPVEDCDLWKSEVNLPSSVTRPPIAQDGFSVSFYTRMLYSCLVDADFLDTEAFMQGKARKGNYASMGQMLERLKEYISPWWAAETALNQKRCEILRQCFERGKKESEGLFTLTVPTGGGKTVSSLAFALSHAVAAGKERVIYVIPYTSIIDQTAEVFRKVVGEENVIEHHSGADFSVPEGEADPTLYRKALATENWDAPLIVTTSVQFFESLYANRPSRCRKLHNLANSVIIFDEAQTLPVPYLRPCVAAIAQLVQFYHSTAVLCTATQPVLQPLFDELASGLVSREICPDTENLYQFFRRTTLISAGIKTEKELLSQLGSVPQGLCVVNRRATAQELYQGLEEEGRFCLTTLLCPADRKSLLEEIRQRLTDGMPCRVVSTSLIEAGVDVDFPAVWREEAGLNSILQTAGRCNREGKRATEDSKVTIFSLESQTVPAMIQQNVDATRSVFSRFDDPAEPAAIESYFQFFLTLKGNAVLDSQNVLEAFHHGMQGVLFPFSSVAEKFHLIENQTVTIYLPVGEGAELVNQLKLGYATRSLYHRLGQYSVNVYPDHLKNLLDAGAAEPVGDGNYILTDTTLYDNLTGLSLDVETGKGMFV